ncbi:isoprenylcysteine carboxylmethyltransferase family protein [Erythrobacter insulae]|uniref:Isoprenylcysteine carboxylmethyltransferase family protein n=1 Tax=Erythrobacter insulae TaxID=2584124 RepID=A0A547PCS4_9SPHN|nr:isoprenylcysteine carboxylmethyltransferase family protein [Erythrobacter insulae]TRD11930.1 isoprenylcysteine carboxylmethyltransferase family protein [Erythrobacter insulae]
MSLRIPPPLVALLSVLLMWLFTEHLPSWQFAVPYAGFIAGALIAAGFGIDIVSVLAFRRAKTTVTPLKPEKASRLVVSGFYRFSRNPMYLGMLLILAGVAVWFGSFANIIILIAFVFYITAFQIKPEEARLDQLFGAEYRAYRQRVRRWL